MACRTPPGRVGLREAWVQSSPGFNIDSSGGATTPRCTHNKLVVPFSLVLRDPLSSSGGPAVEIEECKVLTVKIKLQFVRSKLLCF